MALTCNVVFLMHNATLSFFQIIIYFNLLQSRMHYVLVTSTLLTQKQGKNSLGLPKRAAYFLANVSIAPQMLQMPNWG